jgi:hypothetical protein
VLAIQDDAASWLDRLGSDVLEVRSKAAEELVARGRKGLDFVRSIVKKADGEARRQAEWVVAEVPRREVAALLKKEGHADKDPVEVKDDEFSKVRPGSAVFVVPTKKGCAACGNRERVVVVNDLSDPSGAPVLVKDAADVVGLFAEASQDEARVRAVARAAMFVVRATRPKAHTDELVPRAEAGNDSDNWWKPESWKVEKGEGWTVAGVVLQFDHAWYRATLRFTGEGKLKEIATEPTGMK